MLHHWNRTLGAVLLDPTTCRFRVWAPKASSVDLHIVAPQDRMLPMEREGDGYWTLTVAEVGPGTRYMYRLDQTTERPDPASLRQPEDVHGPSEVVDETFDWHYPAWNAPTLDQYVIYEVHIGTWTPAGTFDAAIERLDDLVALGITAIEIMPVNHFPGQRNWGYDGVYLYAAHTTYGGIDAMKRFVDACHARGLAVILDVVYNHLGAEGNYLWDYGPYFTDRYHTPWGSAVNFDGPESDHVRRFFIENALMWAFDFHIDAFRLDAVHAIFDFSAYHIMEELAETVHNVARRHHRHVYLIAETEQNDPRMLRAPTATGFGLDGQWSDDFHHSVHALLTGEGDGYYADFVRDDGSVPVEYLVRSLRHGFAYSGQYSRIRRRRHGRQAHEFAGEQFVICIQNHDQVGNRMLGQRFSTILSHDQKKLAAALLLINPFTPLLFMGEEYGEPAPFLYFIHHNDPDLVEAVRNGRKSEFATFAWQGEPPDPQAEETFERSKLDHSLRLEGQHAQLYQWYASLLRLRRTNPALHNRSRQRYDVHGWEEPRMVMSHLWHGDSAVWMLAYFDSTPTEITVALPQGTWSCGLDSQAEAWGGTGTSVPETIESTGSYRFQLKPYSCIILIKEQRDDRTPS